MTSSRVIHGDCIDVMRTLPTNSLDSIVTDPPYGLGFMGKAWDQLPPGLEWAEECLRVLKPGGHMLAFGGTRTWHRLAVAVEDAGFEIRDSIFWLYGSGFPKHRAALKPACEPVVMARKPFKGSLTTNEAIHGTGALNIDGCRIWHDEPIELTARSAPRYSGTTMNGGKVGGANSVLASADPSGRWPANVVIDEATSDDLDAQSGTLHALGSNGSKANSGLSGSDTFRIHARDQKPGYTEGGGASRFFYVAKASKRERPAIDGVSHPTVKPVALMRWLVKLVTPPSGTVLEPFAGSGTTVEACILEGFNYIAIEREAEYLPLIQHRIERAA